MPSLKHQALLYVKYAEGYFIVPEYRIRAVYLSFHPNLKNGVRRGLEQLEVTLLSVYSVGVAMRFNQRILRLALATSSLGLRVNCHVGAVQPDIESVLAAPEVPVQPKRQKGHSLFWDFTSLNITQKIKLLEHVKSFGEAQCHIDWDLLKDRYHVATLQSARRLGKRPPRARRKRRRKRMNDWKVQDTVKSKLNIKQTAEEKMDETINTLNSLIEDALDNAGFADIEEQLKEAEIRVQKKQEAAATEAPSAGDTEPASDDDAMVETEAPVAADDVPAVGDDASATGDDTTSSKDDDTSTKDDDAPAAGDDESSGIDDDAEPTGDNEAAVTAPPSTADDASSTGDDTPPASDDKPANEDDAVATGVGTSTDDEPASTKAPTSDGGDGDALPNEDSVIIPNYVYNRGNCPDAGDSDAEVPCAPDNLDALCDKYQEGSSFTLCWQACIPSFCCIHGTFVLTAFSED
jgi:hypothetical protein